MVFPGFHADDAPRQRLGDVPEPQPPDLPPEGGPFVDTVTYEMTHILAADADANDCDWRGRFHPLIPTCFSCALRRIPSAAMAIHVHCSVCAAESQLVACIHLRFAHRARVIDFGYTDQSHCGLKYECTEIVIKMLLVTFEIAE
jgi:hypothetical protein